MPKKFLEIAEAIKNCSTPIMIFLSKGEVASRKTTLRVFSDGSGVNLVTNIDKIYSPVTGALLPTIEKCEKEVANESFNELDKLTVMKTETNIVMGVDPDLAFELAGSTAYCPLTGKETIFHYMETAEDDSDDSDDYSDSDTVDDTFMSEEDDDSSEDDGDYSDDEEEEIFTDDDDSSEDDSSESDDTTATDDSKPEEASDKQTEQPKSEDTKVEAKAETVKEAPATTTEPKAEVKETVEQPKADNTNTEVKAEAASEETPVESAPAANQQEVHAIATADPNANLKLVSLSSDNHEVAAFVGGVHVGTLYKNKASETAAKLYTNGQQLVSAFKPVFNSHRDNQTSKELSSYGYVPVTFKINVGDLFNKRIEKETASIQTNADMKIKSSIGDMSRLIELAFVGINKGLFPAENDLASEIASLLKRNGVKNADLEARRVLAKSSHKYIRSGVEKAKELSSQSEDYVRGIAETVSKSEFIGSVNSETHAEAEAASYVEPIHKIIEKAEYVSNFDSQKSRVNKYSHLFKR